MSKKAEEKQDKVLGKLTALKARAYDLIAHREGVNAELQKVNGAIAQLATQVDRDAYKKDNGKEQDPKDDNKTK